jgi:hypothetical protein
MGVSDIKVAVVENENLFHHDGLPKRFSRI